MKRHEITNILSLSVQKHIKSVKKARKKDRSKSNLEMLFMMFRSAARDNYKNDNFNKDEYLKHLSEDVFTVKIRERSTGRIIELNPNIDNSFSDTMTRNLFHSGEYILISGNLPDKQQSWLIPNLKSCPCGCRDKPLLMYEKDKLYFCGGPTENVFAICSTCGRHTEKSDIATTINSWNNGETIDAR